MKALSLFSGVGGMDLGLERAGIETVAMCEIDKNAREVLRRHWPNTPIHDDATTFDAKEWHGRVDLVHGGSPCQDLSVAGSRAGLDGERSGLFWHQCRIAAECAAPWVLWENVPGAFSSNNGHDFAAVLWGLTGTLPVVPADGWRSMGCVVGPIRFAVWRVLDARWFGVPQRRRRVFVVSGPRGLVDRGLEVLLESESSGRDSLSSGTTGKDIAGTLGAGTPGGGWASDTERMTFIPVSFGWQNAPTQGDDVVEDGVASLRTVTTPAVATPDLAVRRLTPVECERLMGWPDDWTRWHHDGTEQADSHRYRQCGNGVVSNVTQWIGTRLLHHHHT